MATSLVTNWIRNEFVLFFIVYDIMRSGTCNLLWWLSLAGTTEARVALNLLGNKPQNPISKHIIRIFWMRWVYYLRIKYTRFVKENVSSQELDIESMYQFL